MEHDYSKDLTFIFTGSGDATPSLIQSAIDQYVFGTLDSRNVRVIMPVDHTLTKGQDLFSRWAKSQGLDLTLIKFMNDPFPDLEEYADNVFTVSTMREMMDATFGEIAQTEIINSHETAFISLYKSGSAVDLEWVEEAKNYEWLTTLNLSSGLIDHFDGYESTDDKIKREAAEQRAAEIEQQEKETAKAAKKTAAKKATTPRKRAASTPKMEEPTKPVIEPEKPAVGSSVDSGWGEHKHKFVCADDGIGHSGSICACGEIEPDNALSATVVVGSSLPSNLEPAKISTPDVWSDISAAAVAIPADSLVVKRSDMAELAESIEDMGKSFTRTIATLTKILREN